MKHSDARTPAEIATEFEAIHGRKLAKNHQLEDCRQCSEMRQKLRTSQRVISRLEESLARLEAENMKLREVINVVYSCLEFDRSFTGFVARAKRLIEETKNEEPSTKNKEP